MNAKLSLTRSALTNGAILGAIAMLSIPLSACQQSRDANVQTAEVGNGSEPAIAVQSGEKIRLEGVRFKADGTSIRPASKPILDAAAEILKSEPDKNVYVDAYTDPIGGKQTNLRLSQERAENVKAYLETQGISSDRMIPRGFGAADSIASNDTPETRKQNRRVELVPFAK